MKESKGAKVWNLGISWSVIVEITSQYKISDRHGRADTAASPVILRRTAITSALN